MGRHGALLQVLGRIARLRRCLFALEAYAESTGTALERKRPGGVVRNSSTVAAGLKRRSLSGPVPGATSTRSVSNRLTTSSSQAQPLARTARMSGLWSKWCSGMPAAARSSGGAAP
jgi:hypothetical protein